MRARGGVVVRFGSHDRVKRVRFLGVVKVDFEDVICFCL